MVTIHCLAFLFKENKLGNIEELFLKDQNLGRISSGFKVNFACYYASIGNLSNAKKLILEAYDENDSLVDGHIRCAKIYTNDLAVFIDLCARDVKSGNISPEAISFYLKTLLRNCLNDKDNKLGINVQIDTIYKKYFNTLKKYQFSSSNKFMIQGFCTYYAKLLLKQSRVEDATNVFEQELGKSTENWSTYFNYLNHISRVQEKKRIAEIKANSYKNKRLYFINENTFNCHWRQCYA